MNAPRVATMVMKWADWTFSHSGYSREAPEARLVRGGSGGRPAGPRVPNIDMPPDVKAVDREFCELARRFPDWAFAVRVRYAPDEGGRLRQPCQQVEVWRRRKHTNRRRYYEALSLAHAWLDARLL